MTASEMTEVFIWVCVSVCVYLCVCGVLIAHNSITICLVSTPTQAEQKSPTVTSVPHLAVAMTTDLYVCGPSFFKCLFSVWVRFGLMVAWPREAGLH